MENYEQILDALIAELNEIEATEDVNRLLATSIELYKEVVFNLKN